MSAWTTSAAADKQSRISKALSRATCSLGLVSGCLSVTLILLTSPLAILATGPPVVAQDFQVRSWHVEDGLPDRTVTALAQTPDGYLWVGTPKGLARFDGNRFTRVKTAAGTELKDAAILALSTDRQGGLWIASESGLITEFAGGKFQVRYPPEAGRQEVLASISQTSGLQAWRLLKSYFAFDSSGSVWASTATGELVRFGAAGRREVISLEQLPDGRLRDVRNDESGRVWLLKGTNCCVLDEGRWHVWEESVARFGSILYSGDNRGLWLTEVTSASALIRWLETDSVEGWRSFTMPAPPPRRLVSSLLKDRKGRLWLGTVWNGVFVQFQGGEWSRVQASGWPKKGTACCLFEDRAGSIWVGMIGQGLRQVIESSVEMVMLPAEAADVHSTTICAAKDGTIWIGTDKGLYRRAAQPNAGVEKEEALGAEGVLAILEDTRTNLWIGTRNGVLLREGRTFKRVASLPVSYGGIVSLYEDRAGGIWAGGYHGTLLHLPAGARSEDFESKSGKASLVICCIAEDAQGRIWVANKRRGIPLWRLEGERLVPAGLPVSDPHLVGRSVLCDKDGTLWLGTLQDGLFRWSQQELKRFTTADGLPDDMILGLRGDGRDTLWMTSQAGIIGCSRRQLAEYLPGRSPALLCTHLTAEDGMANRQCTGAGQPVISPGPDGRFWVATMLGAAGFFPEEVSLRPGPPTSVWVDTLRADGQMVAAGPHGYRVPLSTRRLEFQYSAPEFRAPQSLRFRYRLDGLEQNWEAAGARRFATYGQLPAGEYHFRVMVGGPDGSWQEAKMPAILEVVPRFWQTEWFRILVGAVALLMLIGAVTWNERRKARRRLERLEARHAVEQVRQRIARDLHDELGSAITEIVQLGDLTLQSPARSEALRPSVEEMTGLARRLGIAVDEIVWTMSSRNDTLPNLVGYLSNYAQEFLRHSGIRCRLDVTRNLPRAEVNSQARHSLFLAFKEAVNNAAKHSKADEVVVRVHHAEGVLKVLVEDNGAGFDAERVVLGEGLRNMQERLQALDGKAELLPRPGGGTRVVFTLAVGGAVSRPAESPQ